MRACAQRFVALERLPYNRDYKGILGNILAIRKGGRPRYRSTLTQSPEGDGPRYPLVPGRTVVDGDNFLWESQVSLDIPLKPVALQS